MSFVKRGTVAVLAGAVVTLAAVAHRGLPNAGAYGLLKPARRSLDVAIRDTYNTVTLEGAGVTLVGWSAHATAARRGTILYLHGVADNRGSALPALQRFPERGFAVVAYDSRAHGDSGGTFCTYGFYEKRDLQRVIDQLESGPVIVIGSSLGAAVAIQAAAVDTRIKAVVAAESFSDLRTVATERAPWFFTTGAIHRAFVQAEGLGRFSVDDVSPLAAARRIRVPVLLIHGADDKETPPEHSRTVFEALGGPRQLLIVEGAGHNQSLQPWVWSRIEAWIDAVFEP
jgi:pimeloyl-ACP methyl ester carboxylesterase